MMTFRRIKIQATVETAPMLLTEDQIAGAVRDLRDGLTRLDVTIIGIDAKGEPRSSFRYRWSTETSPAEIVCRTTTSPQAPAALIASCPWVSDQSSWSTLTSETWNRTRPLGPALGAGYGGPLRVDSLHYARTSGSTERVGRALPPAAIVSLFVSALAPVSPRFGGESFFGKNLAWH